MKVRLAEVDDFLKNIKPPTGHTIVLYCNVLKVNCLNILHWEIMFT